MASTSQKVRDNLRAYQAAWYAANREKVKERVRLRHLANPEIRREQSRRYEAKHSQERKEYLKQWYLKNRERCLRVQSARLKREPEKRREYLRKRYWSNREEIIAKKKRWVSENPERRAAYEKKWRRKNPAQIAAKNHRRRIRTLGIRAGDQSLILKWESKWRTRKLVTCYWCGGRFRGLDCEADHIVPVSRGGAHSIENMAVSCRGCNAKKHAHMPDVFVRKLQQAVMPLLN